MHTIIGIDRPTWQTWQSNWRDVYHPAVSRM